MSYKALYRKYRPQTFQEVSDQEHITRTLMNALKEGKVSHAYMFSGPRGVGKTSVAKIFAKAVNCPHNMSGEPCEECEICKGIKDGSNPDVIEIDAASNNGVDEIRDLRERVKFLPTMCRYKVYIIDEVHMLTTAAFNALLKTLEEPPKHVIFILCTTEPQKVPATIQSRCQRFEFHLISSSEIEKRLKEITRYEYITIEDEALRTIAEVAEGGMRDALSLLDEADAYSTDSHITLDDVLLVSGKLSSVNLIQIAKALYEGNALEAINILDELMNIGKEIPKIMNGLIVFYKDILVIKNAKPDLMKVGYDSEDFKYLVQNLSNQELYKNIDTLSQSVFEMRMVENQKLYTELAFIKMADKTGNRYIEPSPQAQVAVEKKPEPKKEDKAPVAPVKPIVEEKPIIEEAKEEHIQIETPKEEVKEEAPQEEVKPVVQEIEEKEEENEPQLVVAPPKEEKGTFDITLIENTLNNASKPLKEEIAKNWSQVLKSTRGTDLHKAAVLLQDAKLCAASSTFLILSFEEVSFCNLIMKPENKEKVKQLFKAKFNQDLGFIAIPESAWDTLSTEFVQKFRKNLNAGSREFVHLTPIYVEGLKIMNEKKEEIKKEDEGFDFLKDFGDILEVK